MAFKFINSTNKPVHIGRKHKYGDEPSVNIEVLPGETYEGTSTVYEYTVPRDVPQVFPPADPVPQTGDAAADVDLPAAGETNLETVKLEEPPPSSPGDPNVPAPAADSPPAATNPVP